MANKAPGFMWYPKDCDTDENVKGMDDREFGFYMRCLNHCWLNGGLPEGIEEIARVMGRTRRHVECLWGHVGKCFEVRNGRTVNPKQEEQRASVREYIESRKHGAKERWRKYRECTSTSIADARAEHVEDMRVGSGNSSLSSKNLLPSDGSIPANGNQFSEDRQAAWEWFLETYPGEVKPDWDSQVFVSVISTFEDISLLRSTLPNWAATRKWADGFAPTAENFLRKRQFRSSPRDAKAQPPQQPAKPVKTVPYDPLSQFGQPEVAQ